MAKDSNKRRVLDRKKQELDHALRHNYSIEKLHVRAEKLRTAVLAVLKKMRSLIDDSLVERWKGMCVEEVLERAAKWDPHPTWRDIRLANEA